MFRGFPTQCVKKSCLRFAILSYSEKLWNVFEIVLEKCVCTKIVLFAKIFRKENSQTMFVVYVSVICPLSKFGGNRTNWLWRLALYRIRFKWKNWFEKTALHMSNRRVILNSRQNLKPPFTCQYLTFFDDLFVTLGRYTVSLIRVDFKRKYCV